MFEEVIEILSKFTTLKKEEMTKQSELISDLGLNSLDVINVIVAFEEKFFIEIPDSMIKDFNTIGDIVAYLEENV